MSKMTSPRKFAEKIALHNQKQAEETAAFDQIMKEVSNVSRQSQSHVGHKSHHLQLAPTLGAYRGGSLPNVNQLGNNTIDLQNALHSLEDIKAATSRSPVGDNRVYRSHQRSSSGHRSRHDTAPYQTPYLSPPSDTSWRRTNSDSALHTSVMAPIDPFQGHGGMSPGSHRRAEMVVDHSGNTLKTPVWDAKKMQPRPRSCEVPGINICPSSDQTETEPSADPIPISNNTGSLPDLTNLHIPSPLPTPLDPEDQQVSAYNHGGGGSGGGGGGSPGNLSGSMPSPTHLSTSPTNHTQVVGQHSPQISPQVSPQITRRHGVNSANSPLGIHATNEHQRRQQHQQQAQHQHRQHQQQQQQSQQQQQAQQAQQQQQQHQQQHFIRQGIAVDAAAMAMEHRAHHQQYPQQLYTQGQPQAVQAAPPNLTLDMSKGGLQYRDGKCVVSTSCTSPTSPVSNPQCSPSPAHSPSAAMPQGSPTNKAMSDAHYQQLQHQFEHQCNMLGQQEVGSPTPGQQLTYNPQGPYNQNHQLSEAEQSLFFPPPGAFYDQAYMVDAQELFQPNKPPPAYPHSAFMQPSAGNIPNIILTGTGESPPRQDFAKEISNAMAGVDNLDPLFSTDSFKLDPLDLDSLQMLTDNDLVADQATEDSFRLDRYDV